MRSRTSTPPRRDLRARRRGFTLVELLVSLTLLTVGLLALAGLAVTASSSVRGGSIQTLGAAIAQARFDSLASAPCQPLLLAGTTAGTAVTRGVTEQWQVQAWPAGATVRNRLRVQVDLTIRGRAGTRTFVTMLPCRRTA